MSQGFCGQSFENKEPLVVSLAVGFQDVFLPFLCYIYLGKMNHILVNFFQLNKYMNWFNHGNYIMPHF